MMIVNMKLENIRNAAIVVYFKALFKHLPERTEENKDKYKSGQSTSTLRFDLITTVEQPDVYSCLCLLPTEK